jgi:hypothetical protein
VTYTVRLTFASGRATETWTYEDEQVARQRFSALMGNRKNLLDFSSLSLTDSDGTHLARIAINR